MARTRRKEAAAREAATKVAEGIGEALARVVNRLESLDAERARVYKQLLALQERINKQVARFGDTLGRTMSTATTSRSGEAGQASKKTRRGAAKRRPKTTRTSATGAARKRPISCGICGTPGHNARGHAKWETSRAG